MKSAAALAALLLLSCAQQDRSPDMVVTDAWARATLPGQSASTAYLTLTNRGSAEDRLLKVTTPGAQAGVHSTKMKNGVMQMRPVVSLVIPAHETVKLEPGGFHIMLTGLNHPLKPGDTLPLTLTFHDSGTRQVDAAVRPASANGAMK